MGPAVQDIWLLTYSPDKEEREAALDELLNSYEKLRHFDDNELDCIEALRGLRIVYYASWIAKRWEDPNFPKLFPQFLDYNYWAEEVETLERLIWSL
tara:strand:- start:11462 stop:11752 length:291 start_codon:yes stop_codon:yes gene_type:complete